jgi:hypothetical protein
MADALFKVGEKVGLVSITKPHLNGEYIVEGIVEGDNPFTCRITNRTLRGKGWTGYGYMLVDCQYLDDKEGCELPWDEPALRKLHKPSKYSFDDLLSEIKSCNMNTIEA